ncbi:MAG: glycosyltransferase, partial [Nitrospirota bacterium]|nr:glycosyltransferase [Nitrospirota bacterium]
EKKIKEVSERLVKSGEEVTVFSSNAQTTEAYIHPEIPLLPPDSELINGVRVRRFPVYQGMRPLLNRAHSLFWKYRLPFNDIVRTIWNGPIIFNMLPHILKEKMDIVVATPFPFLNIYYAYIAKKIRKIPMAIIPCLHTEDVWAFDRKIMYKILSDSEMILTNTDYEMNYLITSGVKKDRISTLGDGINPRDFNRSNPQKFRERYDIGNAPVVLFVGRKEKGKGIDTLLDSMSIVWEKFPQVKLILAGTRTSYSEAIENKVSSLAARKRRNIILIDNFAEGDKSDLYASCDIFTMPSTVESLGIAYLEAWASGKPVIGCRTGAVASLIEQGKDGLLIEYGNHQELASAIVKLLTDEDLRRKLGENGKKKACSKYTWDIITRRFRANLSLAVCKGSRSSRLQSAFIRKQRVVRKNSVIPERFGRRKINGIELKDKIKKILRKVPVLSHVAYYYVYSKMEKFTRGITNKWILYKTYILVTKDPMTLKARNETLADEEQRRHCLVTKAMPMSMVMNMDTQCNLRCIMCIRRKYPEGTLNALRYDFEIFRIVADEVFPYLRWVQLSTAGEPLMANNLREQLRIIKKYSVKVDLITNGTLLGDDLINEILPVTGYLNVSIDGATKGTYESIKVGAKFEQVIENVKRFNYFRRKLYQGRGPLLRLLYVLMRRNIEELPQFIKLAKELEADSVNMTHVIIHQEEMKKESLVYHKELANYYMIAARKKADELNIHLNLPPLFSTVDEVGEKGAKNNPRSKLKTCPFLWKQAIIEWNGDVVPCCVPGHPAMGNVKKKPFRKIWNNEIYQQMRRRLMTDNPFECCKHCFVVAPSVEESSIHI